MSKSNAFSKSISSSKFIASLPTTDLNVFKLMSKFWFAEKTFVSAIANAASAFLRSVIVDEPSSYLSFVSSRNLKTES